MRDRAATCRSKPGERMLKQKANLEEEEGVNRERCVRGDRSGLGLEM